MRRRDFIAVSLFAPTFLRARRSFAQALTKAAVVIGVNKSGRLPVLNAAVPGARKVAAWLAAEEFEVFGFFDDERPVKVSEIFSAVSQVVERGTTERLVVYFSGHGFLSGYSEWWMLSGAPEDPNEAISLIECVTLARESGIPHVAFISDACRSTPDSLRAGRVRGQVIFPNQGISHRVRPEIDQFFASLPGNPAFEFAVGDSTKVFEGIYTSCFLDAFAHPTEGMIETVEGRKVIPNVKLRDYLAREVPARAAAKSLKLLQEPLTILESRDSAYLGRAVIEPAVPAPSTIGSPNILDVSKFALESASLSGLLAGSQHFEHLDPSAVNEVAKVSGFNDTKSALMKEIAPEKFGFSVTGLVVSGQPLVGVMPSQHMEAEIIAPHHDLPGTVVRVNFLELPHRPGSIALRFADGSSTVVAALPGYLVSVVVGSNGVMDVRYASTRDEGVPFNMDELYAAVAATSKFGTFRIEGSRGDREKKGKELGSQLRRGKVVDPSLGIYASYAFSLADLTSDAQSVREFMRAQLGVDLFDVALLANVQINQSANVVPFCPMLSQGWGLLRVKGASVSSSVAELQNHLRPGLWSTFDEYGTDLVFSALHSGRVF